MLINSQVHMLTEKLAYFGGPAASGAQAAHAQLVQQHGEHFMVVLAACVPDTENIDIESEATLTLQIPIIEALMSVVLARPPPGWTPIAPLNPILRHAHRGFPTLFAVWEQTIPGF